MAIALLLIAVAAASIGFANAEDEVHVSATGLIGGSSRISEYMELMKHRDVFTTGENIMCAKVVHSSVIPFRSLLDEVMLDSGRLHLINPPPLRYIASVNRAGTSSPFEISAPKRVYLLTSKSQSSLTQMHACVVQEKTQANVDTDVFATPPDIKVDWLHYTRDPDIFTQTTVVTISDYSQGIECETQSLSVTEAAVFLTTPVVLHSDGEDFRRLVTTWVSATTGVSNFNVCYTLESMKADSAETYDDITVHTAVIADEVEYDSNSKGIILAGNEKMELSHDESGESWSISCIDYAFEEALATAPSVFASATYRDSNLWTGAPVAVWVEFVTERGFRACISETGNATPASTVNDTAAYIDYLVVSIDNLEVKYLPDTEEDTMVALYFEGVVIHSPNTVEVLSTLYSHLDSDLIGALLGVEAVYTILGSLEIREESKIVIYMKADDIDIDDDESINDAYNVGLTWSLRQSHRNPAYISFVHFMSRTVATGVHINYWVEVSVGCIPEKLMIGKCSLPYPMDGNYTGIARLNREASSVNPRRCNKMTAVRSCNLPPASIKTQTDEYNVDRIEFSEPAMVEYINSKTIDNPDTQLIKKMDGIDTKFIISAALGWVISLIIMAIGAAVVIKYFKSNYTIQPIKLNNAEETIVAV